MLDLIEALEGLGVLCHAIVPARGYVTRRLDRIGVPYKVRRYWTWTSTVPRARWTRPVKPLIHVARSARLAAAIRPWKCDVVVTNTLSVIEGALAAKWLGLPHVTHVREFGAGDHGWHFELGRERSLRILASLSTTMVFNSKAVQRHHAPQVGDCPTAVLYNAVPVGRPTRRRDAKQAYRCLMVGTLAPSKGQDQAIRALSKVLGTDRAVALTLVGDGHPDELERLKGLAGELGVAEHVEFAGRADPKPFYAEADALLMCSRREAFGRVTAEAMAHALPVIGARSGGTPELVQDGKTGLLYAPGDIPDLARCLGRLTEDPALGERLGRRGQAWARDHLRPESCAQDFLDILADAMARGRRA